MEKGQPGNVFGELALPLLDELYNFASWLTRDRTEAQDLVQESLLKGLRAFSSFQQGTNFRAWMFRILRNTFLNSRSGKAQSVTVPLDEDDETAIPSAMPTPETILLQSLDRQAVQKAIEELPVHFREVILLCEVEEMSYAEIAETLLVPIGTVMSRLSRARRVLRDILSAARGGR